MGTDASKQSGASKSAAGGASQSVGVGPASGGAAGAANGAPQSTAAMSSGAVGSVSSGGGSGSGSGSGSMSAGGAGPATPVKQKQPSTGDAAQNERDKNHKTGGAGPATANANASASGALPGSSTVASAASSAPPPTAASPHHAHSQSHSANGVSSGSAAGAAGSAAAAPVKPADPSAQHGAVFNTKLTVEDFELLKVVGKGSFGKVMQVRKKDTNAIYAMKVLKKQTLVARKQVAHTQTERRVLEEIDHPFIVSLRYAFQTTDKLYMILDYFTGGELFFHLKQNGKFSEERAQYYAAEITCALECLHKHTVVYRDLKPENVLLDEDGHIKLTDFGLSKASVTGNALTHTFCGTPEYLAPEVIEGKPYGQAVDWWSLGTLLYEMLTGLPPYYSDNLHVMYEKILRDKLTFPTYLSNDAKSFLSRLLDRNPKTRLGGGESDAEEVKKHPFFAHIDFAKLVRRELKPPFKPQTTGEKEDTTNIEDEFKNETPRDTPVIAGTLRSKLHFSDFTFTGREGAGADPSALATPNTGGPSALNG